MRDLFRLGWFGGATLLGLGCSLVSFDELQDGAGASASGGAHSGGSHAGPGGASTGGSTNGGASTTSTSGGEGGSGGGTLPLPPFDWTPTLTATWRFESSAALGIDSGPNDIDLQVSEGAPGSSNESIEGDRALSFGGGARMSSGSDVFATSGSMTFGGWFRTSSVASEGLMGRKGASHGYLMEHLGGTQSGKCYWEANGVITLAEAAADLWLPNTWVHFVCRYDGDTTSLAAVLGGTPVASVIAPLTVAPTTFSLGYADLPFEGLIDEAFFVGRALSDEALRRIYACGIDGKLCTCLEGDPETYASCGRADPVCFGLTKCNATTPEG